MIKKLVIGSVAASALALFFFGRDAVSYVTTSAGWVRNEVKNSVPIEFEISRTREMLEGLRPDIRNHLQAIAKEEVELERLNAEVDRAQGQLAGDRREIEHLHAKLGSKSETYVFAGHKYTSEQVENDLESRFKRFKVKQETFDNLKKMQRDRERSLAAARTKLDAMLNARRELTVELEHMEARMKMIDAAQAGSEFSFDDSRLSRIKNQMADLKARLDVAEKMVGADDVLADEIPLEEEVSPNLLEEVGEYLNSTGDDDVELDEVDGIDDKSLAADLQAAGI